MGKWHISLPPLDEQRRIAEVLGALDDLIDTNERQHEQLLALAFSVFDRAAFAAPLVEVRKLGVTASRGVTPKYSADTDSVVVVNQKCIRGFRVDLNQARRMESRQVRPEKVASPGDTLVNSTGTGTLGRSSRWLGETDVYVDSHVTVVKAGRPEESAFVSYAVMSQVNNIEALAEGSTGQTELSKERLLGLLVPNLGEPMMASIGQTLEELDHARSELLHEVVILRRTRDELLPLLMSGTVRVRPEAVSA
jgi:type I restriction enzyme S subunit